MTDEYQRHLQTTLLVGIFMGAILGAWLTQVATVIDITVGAAVVIASVTMVAPSYREVMNDAE